MRNLLFYLVDGDPAKGPRWCYARSSKQAKTIYRNIVDGMYGIPVTPRGTQLEIKKKVSSLRPCNIYWYKLPRSPSFSGVFRNVQLDTQGLQLR